MTDPALTNDAGRVLVVEDDESTGLFVMTVLRRHGFDPDWIVDAEQAKAVLHDESFDVLLADYRLPGRGGLELARDARRLLPAISVAVMTSSAATDSERIARLGGADDFFKTPLHSNDLVLRITELVHRSRSRRRETNGAPPDDAVALGPVVTPPGIPPHDDSPGLPHAAESGSGEQAPLSGGAFAWRDTDRATGSGGPWSEGTGGNSQARCSALLKLTRQAFSAGQEASFHAPREPDLSDRDIRARASHPSAWRRTGRCPARRPAFIMWASAAPAVSVGSAVCRIGSPYTHTSPSSSPA